MLKLEPFIHGCPDQISLRFSTKRDFHEYTDSFSENQEFVLFGPDSHVFIGPSFDITPRSIWLDRLSLF